jgi:hypothetical protein
VTIGRLSVNATKGREERGERRGEKGEGRGKRGV